jgi:predicted Zn finger-like uncharacterized protein
MIVSCTSCGTRFRVPSEQIGPKGARLRCSRCQHVFIVRPGAADAAAAPRPAATPPPLPKPAAPPAPALDPFHVPKPQARAAPPDFDTDPFSFDLGPDPFGIGSGALEPSAASGAVASSRLQRPAPDLETLLGPPRGVRTGPDVAAAAAMDVTERVELTPTPVPRAPAAAVPPPQVRDELTFTPAPVVESAKATASADANSTAIAPLSPALSPPGRGEGAGPPDEAAPRPRDRARFDGLVRGALSLALLGGVAVALLVAWRGAGAPGAAVVVSGARGGPYENAAGDAVVVVRGRVEARRAVDAPVRVDVELVDGSRVVARAEALAGAEPTAEDVHAVRDADGAAALRRDLDGRAARSLAPGAAAPFAVVFAPAPPDLRGLEVRATAAPGASR